VKTSSISGVNIDDGIFAITTGERIDLSCEWFELLEPGRRRKYREHEGLEIDVCAGWTVF
jgi:hypothetical protein